MLVNTIYYPNLLGGAEISTQILAEGLVKDGYKVVVICASNEKDLVKEVNGVKVYYLSFQNIYWPFDGKSRGKIRKVLWKAIDIYNILMIRKVKSILKNEKPDILHTNNVTQFSVGLWKIAKELNIKTVHTLRDYYLLCVNSSMYRNKQNCPKQCLSCKIFSTVKRYCTKYVDVVVGLSDFILHKHLLHGYFEHSRAFVIHNGVDQQDSNIKEKQFNGCFGYIGRFSKEKGLEELLNIFSTLEKSRFKLIVFGKSNNYDYEKQLKKKYETENIVFYGYEKNKDIIYNMIDCLIVPSLWNEPFGRIIIEAYTYGIPVIVNNVGGMPELVENGKTGYVTDGIKSQISSFSGIEFDSSEIREYSLAFGKDKYIMKYKKIYSGLSSGDL